MHFENQLIGKIFHRGLFAAVSVVMFFTPSAAAQSTDDFILAVEAEDPSGKKTLFVGTPAGPGSIIVLAPPGSGSIQDNDSTVTVYGLGTPLSGVTIKAESASRIESPNGNAQVILLELGIPDGVKLSQASQAAEEIKEGAVATAYSFKPSVDAEPKRSGEQQKFVKGPEGTFALGGVTASSTAAAPVLGGLVFDPCGHLVAVTAGSSDGATAQVVPIQSVSDFLKTKSAAQAFAIAKPCEIAVKLSPQEQQAKAALEESERIARDLAEKNAALEKKAADANAALKALEERNASAAEIKKANETIEAILDEQSSLAEQAVKNQAIAEEARALIDPLVEQGVETKDQLKIGLYVLIGVAVLAVVALCFLAWLFMRSRRLRKDLVAVKEEKRDIEQARAAAEARWNDCVLENEAGLTVKLTGSKLPKARGGVIVGRSREDADVVIDRDDVSRRHARFEVDADIVTITDMGSTNKTLVNGGALTQGATRKLYDGDRIAFGTNEFVFRILRS
jgi:hypothetical protein